MIQSLRIQNYKALRDVSLALTPMHVLIGPNDSGKTSILEAITAYCRSVDFELKDAFEGRWKGLELVWQQDPGVLVQFDGRVSDSKGQFDYGFACRFSPGAYPGVVRETVKGSGLRALSKVSNSDRPWNWTEVQFGGEGDQNRDTTDRIHDALAGVQCYRWNPQFLALPVAPDSSQTFRMTQSGFGLARCLDDILGYDRNLFDRLETAFIAIFPGFRSIKLLAEKAFELRSGGEHTISLLNQAEGKGIYFQPVAGVGLIPASQASDGVLLVLAYLTILHLPQPPRVLLVEEPENGIHPQRLLDVVKTLRDMLGKQERTQIVLTTHSPYVLDLFQPGEVSLCQKGEDGGVHIRRLSESEVVGRLSNVFSLGEIWTSEGDVALGNSSEVARSAK